jgi:YD repeat-containing protein
VITQYAYDAGNRLKTATPTSGTAYACGYDSDGNLTGGATAGTLAYNSANQMVAASAAAGGGGGSAAETIAYAGPGQNQPLTDESATAITYGQSDQHGQPRSYPTRNRKPASADRREL